MMKDELGGKIMKEFVVLRAKRCACRKLQKTLEGKHCKGTIKCAVTKSLTFDYYETCFFDNRTICK